MPRTLQLVCVLVLLGFGSGEVAADFSCRVVAVLSADRLEVVRESRRETLRLVEVSGPKRGRAGFAAARAFTAEQTLDKIVWVSEAPGARRGEARDVLLPGNRSLTRELVRQGLVRWEPSRWGDDSLGTLEADAKAARRGIWASGRTAADEGPRRRR